MANEAWAKVRAALKASKGGRSSGGKRRQTADQKANSKKYLGGGSK
jgi:hypothetical protein